MWNNKSTFNGLSVIPYNNGSYTQAPFEVITKEEFEKRMESLKDVDLTKVIELEDVTNHTQEASCAGGLCEV
jgi:ribonucleoside-diphosphate reductase alpha chain